MFLQKDIGPNDFLSLTFCPKSNKQSDYKACNANIHIVVVTLVHNDVLIIQAPRQLLIDRNNYKQMDH